MTDRIDALKTLLTRLIDSREGYREALDHVTSPDIRDTLADLMTRRERNAAELRSHLARDGHSVPEDGSLLAGTHRAFMDLKGRLAGDGDAAMLTELRRGEDALREAYDDAIAAADGTEPDYGLLVAQHAALETTIAQLDTRRDMAA